MPETALYYLLGLSVGFVGGLAGAWRWRPPVKVEMKIDPAVLGQINELLVMAWLDARGLVWQPKGMEKFINGRPR